MYFDKHEGDFYFYDEKDRLIANYRSYLDLIDPERMLTLEKMEYITNTLKENL